MYMDADYTRRRLEALSEMESRLTFRLTRLSKLLDIHAIRQLEGSALNLTGYRLLMVLNIFHETTAADLSRLMVIDPAQISRAVNELIAGGYVADRPDPSNRRKKLLHLTEKGEAELDSVLPMFEGRQDSISSMLSPEELKALNSALDTITRYLLNEQKRMGL